MGCGTGELTVATVGRFAGTTPCVAALAPFANHYGVRLPFFESDIESFETTRATSAAVVTACATATASSDDKHPDFRVATNLERPG